ncbi:MAG TPA: GNAT family N-acetyltransferase [Polyangiaceae bacterium]|nr:GNAT family N-acetyltransferase [Polyangiaceae bacterium]
MTGGAPPGGGVTGAAPSGEGMAGSAPPGEGAPGGAPSGAGAGLRIRPARPDEAAALSALALRSKAHWGYDAAFLERCRDELTLRPADLLSRHAAVAELGGRVVGFVTIEGEPPEGEIGALFVEPDLIGSGSGAGRALFAHAAAVARSAGFACLLIDADPGAEGFYLRLGARRVGEAPSGSVPGRMLPRLAYEIVAT